MQNTTIQMLQAIKVLTSIGLVFTSSDRQMKAGTLQFTDPKNKPVKYTLHANGYYRKYIQSGFYGHAGGTECYQLNRTKLIPSKWGGTIAQRILIPGEYLLMAQRIVPICLKSRERK